MATQWFDVDKIGLGKQAEQHGKGRLVGELIQNALDEAGVTRIDVTLEPVPGRPLAHLAVEDDSPEGFRDLSHAYTLFAESYKRSNPQQRGQYNFGEKLVLAACERASISTTKGTVIFDQDGRIEDPRERRDRGSVFEGRLRMTRDEYPEILDYLRSLLLPENVIVTLNGQQLLPRRPIHTFQAALDTPVADEQGVMRMRVRKTTVDVYEPLPGETVSLYELGLPIVETGDTWHVNIGQKVPLNRDRDNVRPAYLQSVRTAVLNHLHDRLTEDDANAGWVRQAGSDRRCAAESTRRILDLRFGPRRAAYDPTDPEANKTWVSKGGTLVYGSMLSRDEWKNAKEAAAIVPAGHLCPSPKPYGIAAGDNLVTIIPQVQWTEGVSNIVAYAQFLGRELMAVNVTVSVVSTTNYFAACYAPGRLDFNVLRLGYDWFERGPIEEVDQLLIHEFGHQYSRDHLSEEYHEALCLLGAKLKNLALEMPEELRRFAQLVR